MIQKKFKTIKIDPKMFISPPYSLCPKCKQDTFGVLMINSSSYVRRCRECWNTKTFPLPRLNKTVIYLDQFVISEMMKTINKKLGKSGKVSPFFLKLFEKLDSLVKLQLIICPDSTFHRQESLLYQPEALKRMYEHLSNGITFYNPATIRRFQICSSFRQQSNKNPFNNINVDSLLHGDRNAWQDKIRISVDFGIDQKEIDEYQASRQKTYQYINPVFQRWQLEKNKKFKDWYTEESNYYGSIIVQRYLQSIYKFHYLTNQTEVNIDEILTATQGEENILITSLLHYLPDNNQEENLKKVFGFLQSPAITELPFVKISAALWAAMAYQAAHAGRKKPLNVGMVDDISMVSSLLPYCDAIFIDKEIHNLLDFTEVKRMTGNFKVKTFSMKNKDEFLSYLNDIQSTADKKHLKIVKEVYGEDWPKPFLEMYEYNNVIFSAKKK